MPQAYPNETQVYLPDFCAAGTLFIILLVAELKELTASEEGLARGVVLEARKEKAQSASDAISTISSGVHNRRPSSNGSSASSIRAVRS